jgi:heme ABC exporter ATP-binding subunit CcmA
VSAIKAAAVVQRFGVRAALGPLDFELEGGGRLAVLGGNGSGKTTLLRLLATAARPASGSLELLGRDAVRERPELRRRIGYVGHDPGLYPNLSTLENLRFFCRLHGVPDSRGLEVLALLELGPEAGRRASELSRGRRLRLALARSLLHDPELWILDEPEAGLDEAGRELLVKLADGRTVVVATHDRALASALCTRSLTLVDGRISAGPELEVLSG